jgi:membrane protein required for colicin V production
MSLNWLDVLLGGILLLSCITAIRNGLTKEVIRLIALIGGVVGGMWWYRDVAVHLRPYLADEGIASFAGFVTILLGSLITGMIIAWILVKVLGWVGLRWFDRLLGGAFGLVRGVLVSSALVLGLLAFAPLTGSTEIVAESRIAPWVLHVTQVTSLAAPAELRQAYDDSFARVQAVWVKRLAEPSREPLSGAELNVPKESPLHGVPQ